MLSKSIGQNGKSGRSRRGGVRGDDSVVLQDCSVEVDVVGEADLDDPINPVDRKRANSGGRVGVVESHGVRYSRAHVLQVVVPSHGADDFRSAPLGKLRRKPSDTAQRAMHEDGQAFDWAIGKHCPVCRDS